MRRLLSALLRIARLDQDAPPARSPADLVELCRAEVERRIRYADPDRRAEIGNPTRVVMVTAVACGAA